MLYVCYRVYKCLAPVNDELDISTVVGLGCGETPSFGHALACVCVMHFHKP